MTRNRTGCHQRTACQAGQGDRVIGFRVLRLPFLKVTE